jgi:hypothetical protein
MSTQSFCDVNRNLDEIDDIINDMEIIQIKKKIIKNDNETQTENNILNTNNETQTENNILNTNNETQTENNILNTNSELSEINILKIEIESLKIKNLRLEGNFKEICNLLVMFTKIDIQNPEIDKIRRQLTILVNRELRMNYAFPFVNILSSIR